jgi:anthranilate phosphoribosyltransferase
LGISQNTQESIFGGSTVEDAAKIFMNVIEGHGTEAQNNVVCANAGLAIATTKQIDHKEGFELAKEALLSGKGLKALQTIQELSK